MALPMHPSRINKTGREWYAKRVSSTGQWLCCSVQNPVVVVVFFFLDIRLCILFSWFLTAKVRNQENGMRGMVCLSEKWG